MRYLTRTLELINNYGWARLRNKPSTAQFWYLPEPANIKTTDDLIRYQHSSVPFYFMDYRSKLSFSLENDDQIIVLPYAKPIGLQINPEAAFQYALGLHDMYYFSKNDQYLKKFWHYVNYFLSRQTQEGLWSYDFDWFGSKAPWYSALAQARGASVMLRAWQHSQNETYLTAAKSALKRFQVKTDAGGFLHLFSQEKCSYFEEYPHTPTGVLNGFMAALLGIWELQFWTKETWISALWEQGVHSLQLMLPHYSTGWWSLYDLDKGSPIANINSPRYHLLEIQYLQILSILSNVAEIKNEYQQRVKQYARLRSRVKAFNLKLVKKIIYR